MDDIVKAVMIWRDARRDLIRLFGTDTSGKNPALTEMINHLARAEDALTRAVDERRNTMLTELARLGQEINPDAYSAG